ncbi:hypothetical protein D9757_009401 [Collybiopsis confluens]|uniref:MFS general substrate transporter n=1 Tax=Collybiopsis confluens TaxID=2823264 RepID=A0A8H5M4Q2_9AGAR|nr:hypothetical protein D9757_009401 [Collybiopsis confluens]
MSRPPPKGSGKLKLLDPEKRPLDEAELQRVLRKLDYHLLPIIVVLFMLASLDRVNIGNAKILGMTEDANLSGLRYNIVRITFFIWVVLRLMELQIAAVYFIPYCLGEVPAYGTTAIANIFPSDDDSRNIMLKIVRPSRWIPLSAITWGLIVTLMSLCNTFKSLIITRFFVGLAESAYTPAIIFYLSTWYPRRQLALRMGIFASAGVISGAFSGALAYAIVRMDQVAGLHGWQWIFCLEGIVTILFGLVSVFFIHDSIQTASFLTISEKDYLQRAITLETFELASHVDKRFIWQACKDYRIHIQALSYLGIIVPYYSILLFLPTLVKELGYQAIDAQLFTVPPIDLRTPFILLGALVGIVGFIIALEQKSVAMGYVSTFIATSGCFTANVAFVTWYGTAYAGEMKRGQYFVLFFAERLGSDQSNVTAVAIAMINGLGNLGGYDHLDES